MNLAIELNDRERDLVSRIDFDLSGASYDRDSWPPMAEAMAGLMQSLLVRNAIPLQRRRYFTDPECFIGGHGLSHAQTFEKNGTQGDEIFRHGNFLKYLQYFVYGPNLPQAVISAVREKVTACGSPFTGSDALEVADIARGLTRSHCLDTHKAPEEFYKLALDCGLDPDDARTIRDSVQKVRASR